MSFLTNAVMVKQHRLETAKQHHLRQAVHYRRVGSASYRSTSDRFGCGADAAMQGRKAAENPRLAESKLSDRACIGLYVREKRRAEASREHVCMLAARAFPKPPCVPPRVLTGGHPARPTRFLLGHGPVGRRRSRLPAR